MYIQNLPISNLAASRIIVIYYVPDIAVAYVINNPFSILSYELMGDGISMSFFPFSSHQLDARFKARKS